ncbi:hypothetical protein K439DRAFT_1621183 [Ramaria rubella]|nr:hypothetical protein K439DRAFT_1621183 [Ramaria rubella]
MNDSNSLRVVDDFDDDDVCSCDSVYHSLIDTLDGAPPPGPVVPLNPGYDAVQASLNATEPDHLVSKVERAHERARQRMKKSDDIAKGKRCVRCRYCQPWKWEGNGGRPKGNRGRRISFTEAEGERKVERNIYDTPEDECRIAMPPVNRNVSLTDLIKTPRKGSGAWNGPSLETLLNSITEKFEVIGRPRQVLVLDEFTEIDAAKFELEDWEYVEGVNQRKALRMAPSYANIVASRA